MGKNLCESTRQEVGFSILLYGVQSGWTFQMLSCLGDLPAGLLRGKRVLEVESQSFFNVLILDSYFFLSRKRINRLDKHGTHSVSQFSCSVVTPWTAAHQASLSITNSQSVLKLTSIESVIPSNHLILCQSPSPLAFNLSKHQGLFK